jgi:UDP-glucuronate 4-epimerase
MFKFNKKIAVTGAAGFIGSHLIRNLVDLEFEKSLGIDSFSPIYGGNWCNLRQEHLIPDVKVLKTDLLDLSVIELAEALEDSEILIHLAAYPGVLEGETKKQEYLVNNVISSGKIIEACRLNKNLKAILFASSSSVYGDLALKGPCKEMDANGTQFKSHYAMTKWFNEVQFRSSQKELAIPVIGLRFFTVFGEWGRPDMAYGKFTESILRNEPLKIYGGSDGARNMTHIDDVIEIMIALINKLYSDNFSKKYFDVFNIASRNYVSTLDIVETLGKILRIEPKIEFIDRPSGDAVITKADTTKIEYETSKLKSRNLFDDLQDYTNWHKEFWPQGMLEKNA